jgi:SAM-dependent methyltransferase
MPEARDSFWEFERKGWERAAPRYAECWTDTALFVSALLQAADVHAGTRLLDVACGPGFVSEAAAERGAEPTGVDVAQAMLDQARQRCPRLTFTEGDAQALPFPDAAFDSVTMNFGILHLAQPELALAEARRVLVPGGHFAFTSWVAEGNAEAEITDAVVGAHAMPVEVPEGPDYYAFSDADETRSALETAGFDRGSTAIEVITVPWRIPTADTLFDAQLNAGVRTAAVLREQPPERLDAIRQAMADAVRQYADGDGFVLPIVARVISARAPE